MATKNETIEDLLRWLFHIQEDEPRIRKAICVGIIGDFDITEYLTSELYYKLLKILEVEND